MTAPVSIAIMVRRRNGSVLAGTRHCGHSGVDWIGLSLCLRYPDTSRIRVRLTEVICRSVRFAVGERVLGVPK